MSREFTREAVMKFLPAPFSWNWCKCLLRSLIHSKISNLTKYKIFSRKIFTAHYACRNAALNLTPVTGTTNGFICQIINSSWGVRLTWFNCNSSVIMQDTTCDILVLWLNPKAKFHKMCFQLNKRTGFVHFARVL